MCQLTIYCLSAPNLPFHVCSAVINRSPSAFLLYSEHDIKFSLRVEEGTTGGKGFSAGSACPRPMHYPQWSHKPCKKSDLEITFLWSSQHRNHIFQALYQCPSSPYNLCSATCQEPQICSGPGKSANFSAIL